MTTLALLMLFAPPGKPQPAQYGWLTDYPAARAQAAKTGQPILLVLRCEP